MMARRGYRKYRGLMVVGLLVLSLIVIVVALGAPARGVLARVQASSLRNHAAREPAGRTASRSRSREVADASDPVCAAGQLALSSQLYQVGMPGAFEIYSITNVGVTPCSLVGAPIFAAKNADGQAVEADSETFSNAAGGAVESSVAGDPVDLSPGASGSFAVWWQNCSDPVPSSGLTLQNVTTIWTFSGQEAGITRVMPNATVSCPNVVLVASEIEPGVMSSPPWLPAPSAGLPPGGVAPTEGSLRSN